MKFSKLYSDYAIKKVLNSKEIREQNLFVIYSYVGVKILQDIIKGIFKKQYLVDYVLSLKDKPKKKKRLLNMIDNDITKEKLALKITYQDYLENKEEIYELTREGFHIALILDETFAFNEETKKLLKVFTFLITSHQALYDVLKESFEVLYIPS